MNFLNDFSGSIVERGFDYYKNNAVIIADEIERNIFKGVVLGNGDNKYQVQIDLNNFDNSHCDCAYAKGGYNSCKHMVALYFATHKSEALDYEKCISSKSYFNYEELFYEIDERYYYDDEEDEYDFSPSHVSPDLPEVFDELLDEYVNELSLEELKQKVKEFLSINKHHTFEYVLNDKYLEYKNRCGRDYEFIQKLKYEIKNKTNIVGLDYYQYFDDVLECDTKQEIFRILNGDSKYKDEIVNLLCNPLLTLYMDYEWIANAIDEHLKPETRKEFVEELEDFANALGHYRIEKRFAKSCVLRSIFMLKAFSPAELAKSLIDNNKYVFYSDYVMNHYCDLESLYEEIIKLLESGYAPAYTEDISNPIISLALKLKDKDEEIEAMARYWDYAINYDKRSLEILKDDNNVELIERATSKYTDDKHRLIEYAVLGKDGLLFELVKKFDKKYIYDENLEYLKNKYSKELYEYYRSRCLEKLEEGMGREIYRPVAEMCVSINKLDKNHSYYNEFVLELENSKHAKKPALFDEISKAIKQSKNKR